MRRILLMLLLALALSGCKTIADIKPDTIVDIPLHPTQPQTEEVTECTDAPTEVSTEASTAVPTQTSAETAPSEPTATKPPENKKPEQSGSNPKPPSTEPPTERLTEPPTETPTVAVTQPPTEIPTESPTQPPTEIPTQSPTQPPVAYDPSGYTPGSLDRGVAEAVNRHRQAAGLEPLTLDPRLCAIASVRAWEVTVNWDHKRPDGTPGLDVLNQYGYAYTVAAENLYFGVFGPEAIVEKWMGSSSHREKMLSEAAAAIGVGTYVGDDGLTYLAALFVG